VEGADKYTRANADKYKTITRSGSHSSSFKYDSAQELMMV
jgi:hypothetical protein